MLTCSLSPPIYGPPALHGSLTNSPLQNGEVRFLICTDVAARGIDITGIPYVVNVTLPDEKQNYVHRIGRVGRAERMGLAISIVAKVKEKVCGSEYCITFNPFSSLPPSPSPTRCGITSVPAVVNRVVIPGPLKMVDVPSGMMRCRSDNPTGLCLPFDSSLLSSETYSLCCTNMTVVNISLTTLRQTYCLLSC